MSRKCQPFCCGETAKLYKTRTNNILCNESTSRPSESHAFRMRLLQHPLQIPPLLWLYHHGEIKLHVLLPAAFQERLVWSRLEGGAMEYVTFATRINAAWASRGQPSCQSQESAHPHFFFLSSGFEAPASHSFYSIALLHDRGRVPCLLQGLMSWCLWRLLQWKAIGICRVQLHHGAEVVKRFPEDALWHLLLRLRGICRGEVNIILTD